MNQRAIRVAKPHLSAKLMEPLPPHEQPDNVELSQLLMGPMVTARVGKRRKPFSIHKDLICYHSSFFNGAFEDGAFVSELQKGVVSLPDADEDTFSLFTTWLYQRKITYDVPDLSAKNIDSAAEVNPAQDRLNSRLHLMIRLYLLGDRYDVLKLCSQVLYDIANACKAYFIYKPLRFRLSDENVQLVACETPGHSALREFMLAFLKHPYVSYSTRPLGKSLPEAFYVDLLEAHELWKDMIRDVLSEELDVKSLGMYPWDPTCMRYYVSFLQ